MKSRDMVQVQLKFAGVLLPVSQNEQGKDVVPLKPISDVIGLDWETQRKRVNGDYLRKRLGTCTGLKHGAGMGHVAEQQREMTCIRLDRVAAWLNGINPERVRVNGNESAADFLERKHEEWDDILHTYEQGGFGIFSGKVNGRKGPTVRDFLSVLKAKRLAESEAERECLNRLAMNLADELGAPFQMELTAKEGA